MSGRNVACGGWCHRLGGGRRRRSRSGRDRLFCRRPRSRFFRGRFGSFRVGGSPYGMANLFGYLNRDRAGVRLLLGDAKTGQQ
ncbi:MAG TPA: hypothetical protein VKB61_05220, partial [Candidatus Acidoferrum sp.]|nr:hypothetical protein [Candidatus Acidoferrum sp.]